MAIIIDYSQAALANIFMFQADLTKNSNNKEAAVNIIRHAILSSIKFYKNKFKEFGNEVIIAADGQHYWRREIFPYYKGNRSKQREKSNLDWHLIFDTMSKIRDEIKENFPYKVVRLDRAEADDVIAVLTDWMYTNKVRDAGFFEEPEPIVLVGSDKDMFQLHVYANVRQWSPTTKKFINADINGLTGHIAKGDSVDAIPNVLSDDDTIVTEGKRQNKMSAKRLEEFAQLGRDACINDFERRNWDRNNTLINFKQIPSCIADAIISEYLNSNPKRDLNKIMEYLMHNKCVQLLSDIESF